MTDTTSNEVMQPVPFVAPPPESTPFIAPPPPLPAQRQPPPTSNVARYAGQFTLPELAHMFGMGVTKTRNYIGDTPPSNPHEPELRYRWSLSDICTLTDTRVDALNLTPSDKLAMARTLVAKQDERAKRLKNDVYERTLIPDEEIQTHIAKAFKVFGRWLDLLPDFFERKGYIKPEKMNGFIVVVESAKKQLLEDLTGL